MEMEMVSVKKTSVGVLLVVASLVAACSSSKGTAASSTNTPSSGAATTAAASTSAAPATASAVASAPAASPASSAPAAAGSTVPTTVSGSITVLTNRTDLTADGTMAKYAADFNKIYPNVKVTFQGITNYEGDVKTRMNTSNYGDVLLIPSALPISEYPTFFEPLGSAADLSAKYNFTASGTVNGQVYGIAQNGNANGFVYNKTVWAKAGITTWPTTPDQYISDLQAIKAKTSAIPYYTNYKDGWPLSSWEGAVGSPSCSAGANDSLSTETAPWSSGNDLFQIDSLLYNIVHNKLSEPDPTTTNWENSKGLLATGKISAMWLGSWAVTQMQAAAKTAGQDPSEIGFMPWPSETNGHLCSVIGPDYLQGINIHSTHKDAARAWIDWFTDQSTYAVDNGDVPTLKSGTQPPALAAYAAAGVTLVTLTQANSALVNKIDNTAEIGLNSPTYRQKIVDIARGAAGGSLQSDFASLNSKWAASQKTGGA
jgi:raffinose/stachyose/melibiose transport system substrate-binding protein